LQTIYSFVIIKRSDDIGRTGFFDSSSPLTYRPAMIRIWKADTNRHNDFYENHHFIERL